MKAGTVCKQNRSCIDRTARLVHQEMKQLVLDLWININNTLKVISVCERHVLIVHPDLAELQERINSNTHKKRFEQPHNSEGA